MIVPHWLNLRYVSPVYAAICLFAAVAVRQIFLLAKRTCRPIVFRGLTMLGSVAILLALLVDYFRFERGIVRANDLAVGVVFSALRSF